MSIRSNFGITFAAYLLLACGSGTAGGPSSFGSASGSSPSGSMAGAESGVSGVASSSGAGSSGSSATGFAGSGSASAGSPPESTSGSTGSATGSTGSAAGSTGSATGSTGSATGSAAMTGVATGSSTGSITGSMTGTTGAGSMAGSDSGASVGSTTGAITAPDAGATSGSTGGSTAAGDAGAANHAICNFASGLNVAWVKFANDIPNPDIATFQTIFKNTYDAGGRVVRWWLHTNGTVTPGYESSGMVQNLPQSHIDGITSVLNAAHAAGVAIDLSLWSFDMLQADAGATYVQNEALLMQDAIRQSYITNYLTPLVNALKGNPGLYSYEIFNEPEGMIPTGWATYRVAESYIQKTVNLFASAIHTADPTALVTNGSQEFQYCSNVAGKTNYYSDAALRNAGGMQNGTLDFYEVHYYTSNGTSNSCFLHPASYWGLDKKLVMGEFYAADTDGVTQDNVYTYLYSNGYNGAWGWAYETDMPWPSMQAPMQALYTAQGATVGSCP